MPEILDLPDLPDLAGDVRQRAVPPPYDEVRGRVRARRRRGVAAGVVAGVVLVGAVGLGQAVLSSSGRAPEPAQHTAHLPPTEEKLWREVVDGTQAHPYDIAGTDDGSIAVVWRALEQPAPTYALVVRTPDGTVHGLRLDEPVMLTPVPGGWVGVRGTRGWFIGSDGTWSDLGAPSAPRAVQPGDVFIKTSSGTGRLYSPADHTWSVLPMVDDDAYVTPDGLMITCSVVGGTHVWVTMSNVHSPWIDGSACEMSGRGGVVSAVGLGDQPDGGIPLTGLLVKAGDSTEFAGGDFVALAGVSSVTITPSGGTLVTDASTGEAFVLSADRTQLVEPHRKLGVAFVAGEHLYATSYGQDHGPLLYSDDDGLTWQQTTLPGMESSQR